MSVSSPPHNLLSAWHPDTLTASVARGSLIIGNSTPKWSALAVGAANTVLSSDGTDVSWATTAAINALTDTWNNAGTEFAAIQMNVTNTNSAAKSSLLDLQIGAEPYFRLIKERAAYLFNTFTSWTNFEGGGLFWESNVLKIGTKKGSGGGTARDVYIETPSRTAGGGWNFIDASGATNVPASVSASNPFGVFGWVGKGGMSNANADGVIRFMNYAGTGFGRITLGPATSSFGAIKANGAALDVRLGDDSAYAGIQSLYVRYGAGSPESLITAPVGAVYHRTDGGASTSFYVKESGSGNTGWVAK